MVMAAPAAKRLTVRNEEPLSQTEISMATGLLHRAILNGQQSLLINQFRESRAVKATHVPFEQLIDECSVINDQVNAGAMSDAAKRQREFTEDEVGEWDRASMVESQASSYVPYAAAGKGSASAPSAPFHESQQEPKVPDGMTVSHWGMSLCKMDKVKEWNRNGMAAVLSNMQTAVQRSVAISPGSSPPSALVEQACQRRRSLGFGQLLGVHQVGASWTGSSAICAWICTVLRRCTMAKARLSNCHTGKVEGV